MKLKSKLQEEISQILTKIGTLERFAVISSGGLFTWILTHTKQIGQHYSISYFLPAILVIAFGLIVLGLFKRLKLISKYIRDKYEKVMNLGQNENLEFGWETFLDKSLNNKGSLLANARLWMWIFLLFIDFVIAIYFTCCLNAANNGLLPIPPKL